MKRKLLILGASLTIAIPTFVAAEGLLSNQDNTGNVKTPAVVQPSSGQTALGDCTGEGPRGGKGFGSGGQMGKGQGMMGMQRGQGGNFEERKTELLGLVEEYNPKTKDAWQVVIEKRDELKNQWLSPENEEARQTYMEKKQAEMQILRDQLVAGEITREEMRERMMEQKGNTDNPGVYLDLQAAVDSGNNDKVVELLEQMLAQFKERNAELENRLEDVKN